MVSCKQNAVYIICLQEDNIALQIRSAPMAATLKQMIYRNSNLNIINSKKPLSKQYIKMDMIFQALTQKKLDTPFPKFLLQHGNLNYHEW